MNATATIRLEDYEKRALTEFAEFNGMTFSEWARQTLCEAYEDFIDAKIADEAHDEFMANPVTYSSDDLMREYGLL